MFFEVYALACLTYDTERPAETVEAVLGDVGHRWLPALEPFSGNLALCEALIETAN